MSSQHVLLKKMFTINFSSFTSCPIGIMTYFSTQYGKRNRSMIGYISVSFPIFKQERQFIEICKYMWISYRLEKDNNCNVDYAMQ